MTLVRLEIACDGDEMTVSVEHHGVKIDPVRLKKDISALELFVRTQLWPRIQTWIDLIS